MDGGEDDDGRVTIVRKMKWLAPQSPKEPACLFVLLGSFGSDTASLRSVIVALIQGDSTADLKEALSIPPVVGEDVVGFSLAPSWERSKEGNEESAGTSPVPCLLMLTEAINARGEADRSLKIFRCPENPVTMWELESAMLSDPRQAVEVLPGLTPVTSIAGISATAGGNALSIADTLIASTTSISQTLLHSATLQADQPHQLLQGDSKDSKGRRNSTRDLFFDIAQMCDSAHESWELVICSGDRSAAESLDLVMLGHSDGYVLSLLHATCVMYSNLLFVCF